MKAPLICALIATSLYVVSNPAAAQWRCDCTTIVASCSAQVSVEETWIDVTADNAQCARVDYFVDGIPFVALVVEGAERQDWIARTANPQVLVQSCQVCLDNADSEPPITPAPTVNDNGELTPLIQVAPDYPAAAAANGVEGFVEVSFTVTPLGAVEGATVTTSEPRGLFEQAALAAIARWRYPADELREPQSVVERFQFDPGNAILSLNAPPPAATAASTDRNQCIREQVTYNYGEMVEVGLMNTCAEPMLVYSCAEGTGRFQQRWVCQTNEQSQTVMLGPGDGRVGSSVSIAMPDGQRSFSYADNLSVMRAPNSQYWWLACEIDDGACRNSGRQWVRSLDRQAASVDPQARASRRLARSY